MIFKYYIKQCKKINTFTHWDFTNKAKFISISHVIMLTLAMIIPTSLISNSFFTLFFLTTVSSFIYLVCKLLFIKIVRFFSKPAYFKNKKFLINEINKMSGAEFEELLVHLFRQQGFQVNQVPKSDFICADLILKKKQELIVVQTKRRSINIGVSAVNEVVNAAANHKAHQKWIVTNRYYTKEAIAQASVNKVVLLNRDDLLAMLKAYKEKNKIEGKELIQTDRG